MKKKFVVLWSILTAFCAVMLIGLCIGSNIANYYVSSINAFFHCQTYKLVETEPEEGAEKEDTQYYKPKFSRPTTDAEKAEAEKNDKPVFDYAADTDKLLEYNKEITRQAAADGAVLLWNKDGTLPLKDKSKPVNLFGRRSVAWAYGTDGSGGTIQREKPDIKTAFEEAGYTVNNDLWNWYAANQGAGLHASRIDEAAWNDAFAVNGGTGFYVLSRKGAEGFDLEESASVFKGVAPYEQQNMTALSANEEAHIKGMIELKKQGKLDKVVVLLNTVSMGVQFDVLSKYKNDIDACLWVGLGGNSGPAAAVDVITGKVVPSGRLSDTFLYNSYSAPATRNHGDFDYLNAAQFASDPVYKKLLKNQGTGDSTEKNFKYLVYQEGIYVGYKYYETRYYDSVANPSYGASGNAGATDNNGWNYGEEVAYPFGYGMSYTDFVYESFRVEKDGEDYKATVQIKNNGSTYTGREVVQIYLQKPYGPYERDNGIEQAAVNLVGFGKTEPIAPGDYATVTVKIDGDDLLTYDANKAKTYITSEGDYYFAVGHDAHDAVNNILAAQGRTGDKAGNAAMTHKVTLKGNYEVAVSKNTGAEITNRFDDADLNKAGYGTEKITYLSRKDWNGTYPAKKADVSLTEKLLKDLDYGKEWEEDIFADVPETYGADPIYTIFMLWKDTEGNELPYGHELWENLLNQTTFTEQTRLICNAMCVTMPVDSVSAPGTIDCDGPAGLTFLPNNTPIGFGYCYPSENLIASTFDTELTYKIGECLGEECLAFGYTFIYAPAANIHRDAFGGRNGEYYSEDGILSGYMCAAEVKGLQSNGTGAQVKHFALNDTEVNRNGVSIWANEQSIREIYLKAFENTCSAGNEATLSLMSSFTRVGAVWSGAHRGMQTDVLRGEWGFHGFVQSDGNSYPLMNNYVDGLRGGNDLFMCGGGDHALDAYQDSAEITLAMREATHRILYSLSRTHAMNGFSSRTRVVTITPWWRLLLNAIIIIFAVLTAAFAGLLVWTVVRGILKKRKATVSTSDTDENITE